MKQSALMVSLCGIYILLYPPSVAAQVFHSQSVTTTWTVIELSVGCEESGLNQAEYVIERSGLKASISGPLYETTGIMIGPLMVAASVFNDSGGITVTLFSALTAGPVVIGGGMWLWGDDTEVCTGTSLFAGLLTERE
ncbi:MAG: hypothetical protein GY868_10880 [Deltaproteobacteria bacterium]|nr:hypothetical protein [Deltaproteobacteria bacterium]